MGIRTCKIKNNLIVSGHSTSEMTPKNAGKCIYRNSRLCIELNNYNKFVMTYLNAYQSVCMCVVQEDHRESGMSLLVEDQSCRCILNHL